MNKPAYIEIPKIDSTSLLADVLGLPLQEMIDIAKIAYKYYRPNKPKEKPDGTTRQTYAVLAPLKTVQKNINKNIFYKMKFPDYLLGGIRDKLNPRDYVKNADLHTGAKILIKEDIANFFPSIRCKLVFDIWFSYFEYPEEISKILN